VTAKFLTIYKERVCLGFDASIFKYSISIPKPTCRLVSAFCLLVRYSLSLWACAYRHTETVRTVSTHNGQQVAFVRLPHPRTGKSAAFICIFSAKRDYDLTGIPALFLPVENSDESGDATSQILEIQAVDPVNSRSWFLENEVVSGTQRYTSGLVQPLRCHVLRWKTHAYDPGGSGLLAYIHFALHSTGNSVYIFL
jgi:hypothetical protein